MSNAIVQHIYLTATDLNANSSPEKIASTGVCLRTVKGVFLVFPPESDSLVPFEDALYGLDPAVAVKICTPTVQGLLKRLPSEEASIQLDADTTIQVLETMEHLSIAEKSQRAAIIRDEKALVIWEDNVDNIIPLLAELDDKLIKRLWQPERKPLGKKSSSSMASEKSRPRFFKSLFQRPQSGSGGRVVSASRLDQMQRREKENDTSSLSTLVSGSPVPHSPVVSRGLRFW